MVDFWFSLDLQTKINLIIILVAVVITCLNVGFIIRIHRNNKRISELKKRLGL